MDRFREILVAGKVNVLSSTVRYVSPNATPVLAYAPRREAFAIIQMSNVGLSPDQQAHAQAVTRQEFIRRAVRKIVRPDLSASIPRWITRSSTACLRRAGRRSSGPRTATRTSARHSQSGRTV
jgi:hypothetical protein